MSVAPREQQEVFFLREAQLVFDQHDRVQQIAEVQIGLHADRMALAIVLYAIKCGGSLLGREAWHVEKETTA